MEFVALTFSYVDLVIGCNFFFKLNYFASGLIFTTEFNELLESAQLCRTFFIVCNTVYLCQVVIDVTFYAVHCERARMLYREGSIAVW